ncbi:MAG: hypothetical protein ACI4RA_02335 [Kiritimatiellia bacterium]
MRSVVVAVAGLIAGAALAIPKPGYYHPSSVQVGTKTRVIMGGDAVGGVKGGWITGEGAKITRIVPVPGFPRAAGKTERPFVRNWLYDILEKKVKATEHRKLPPEATIAETDWQECGWWFYLDALTDLELQIVARDLYTPERYPQDTPALNNLLILDVEVDPDAKPGRRDIFLYDGNSASAPHPFYITKEPHVYEPFFVYPPRDKRIPLPQVLHLPPDIKPQPLPIHLDGQIWPGETDSYTLRLEEGQQLVCSVIARELFPYLGDAVPGFFNPVLRLYDSRDKEVAFADDFYYLPDPVLTYKVPQDGFYVLKIHDNLFRGGPNFEYTIFCRDAKTDRPLYSPKDRAFACYPQPASFIPPKASSNLIVRTGSIDMPGRVDRHFFTINEPGTWHFELYARREGSPLDGVLQLFGPMGDLPLSVAPLLETWDDNPGRLYVEKNVGSDDLPIIKKFMLYEGSIPQAECDPSGTFTFKEPGRYCVTVADQPGLGGEHYDYTLCISPAEPSFEVFALQSTCLVSGGRTSFRACVLRKDGFTGDITFNSTDDYDVEGGFSEGELEVDVYINFKKPWEGLKRFDLTASGELPNGKTLTVRVTPTDPAEQAFAYSHLLPAQGFYFGIAGESTREAFKYPGPHLSGVKEKHSGGRACISCHEKNGNKRHSKGKTCNECHTSKE